MKSILWQAELQRFLKMREKIIASGSEEERLVDIQDINEKTDISTTAHNFETIFKYENITFSENERFAQFNINCDTDTQIAIALDKDLVEIAYYLNSEYLGDNLLAFIANDKLEIPIYGSSYDNSFPQEIGKLSESEFKDNIKENIKKALQDSPPLRAYTETILTGISSIDILDGKDEMGEKKQLTPEESAILDLRRKLDGINSENDILKGTNERLRAQNKSLEEEKATLQNQNKGLVEANTGLKNTVQKLRERIQSLQKMLTTALNFAKTVNDSVLGRVLFGRYKKQLNEEMRLLTTGNGDIEK